jgi:signal peptidase I
MGDKMSRKSVPPEKPAPAVVDEQVAETPMEALSSICAVLVVGLFILTFLCQNFVIPS